MQRKRLMVKDLGKIKIDVSKTLALINDRMRF